MEHLAYTTNIDPEWVWQIIHNTTTHQHDRLGKQKVWNLGMHRVFRPFFLGHFWWAIYQNRDTKLRQKVRLHGTRKCFKGRRFLQSWDSGFSTTHIWLVVWTIFIFPYIGKNHPNWLSYLSEGLKPPTRYAPCISIYGYVYIHLWIRIYPFMDMYIYI